jgi:hypothetical protein
MIVDSGKFALPRVIDSVVPPLLPLLPLLLLLLQAASVATPRIAAAASAT